MAPDQPEPAFVWDDSGDDSLLWAEPDSSETEDRNASTTRSNPGMLAVFGGLYAVWFLAWVLGVVALPAQPASSVVDAVMYQFGEFLAIVATPLWGALAWKLTVGSKRSPRALWMTLGLVVLFPLPLVLPVVFA